MLENIQEEKSIVMKALTQYLSEIHHFHIRHPVHTYKYIIGSIV